MKRVINGKVYNTETATLIGGYSNQRPSNDFYFVDEDLYITKKGSFFIAGAGGAMTNYAKPVGDATGGGSSIIPLTKAKALEWAEQHTEADIIEKYFGEILDEA